jgi:cell division septation protein DedD
VLQIAAFDDPLRARHLVAELAASGFDAYLAEPPLDNPNAPYRVRVGRFATRAEAEGAAAALTKAGGQKPWITRE